MIIDGHPDILRGPQGLNGLHGFGSLPPQVQSPAYIRFLPEKGGAGIDALYQEIRDFVSTHSNAEILQAMNASGVSTQDYVLALSQQSIPLSPVIAPPYVPNPADVQPTPSENYFYEPSAPVPTVFVSTNSDAELFIAMPFIPDKNDEIVHYVMTHSDAEILAQMAISNVSQSDIIRAFKVAEGTPATGQSAAVTRYLPENGGLGLEALYKEILDYQNTHSLYELLAQMQYSGVSMKDVDAANNYAFGQQQSQAPAEYAAAAAAAKQAAIAAQAAQAQQALNATLAARAAASAAAAAQQAAAQAAANAKTQAQANAAAVAMANATAAAKQAAQQAAAAAAAPTKVFTATGQSPAYTRFLPENGGKGIPALYKEIRDFVNARQSGDVPGPNSEKYRTEIQQAMFASGVTDEDVVNAFANAPMQPVTPKTSTATSGLTFPLILSAIAAYFLVG